MSREQCLAALRAVAIYRGANGPDGVNYFLPSAKDRKMREIAAEVGDYFESVAFLAKLYADLAGWKLSE